MAQEARNCAAKPIDRLIRVADDDQPRMHLGRRDQAQQLELRRIHILELIDQDEPEFRPHRLAQSGRRLE